MGDKTANHSCSGGFAKLTHSRLVQQNETLHLEMYFNELKKDQNHSMFYGNVFKLYALVSHEEKLGKIRMRTN